MGHITPFLLYFLFNLTSAAIYLPCPEGEYVNEEACQCWNPQDPIIICKSAGLDHFPIASKASILNLYDNDITVIPNKTFPPGMGLKQLILSNNKMNLIHRDSFENVDSTLKVLDLSGNEISRIPTVFGHGRNWPNLTHLYLSNNYISALQGGMFAGLHNLKNLYLDDNAIVKYSPDSWRGLSGMYGLTLSPGGMDIKRIPTQNLNNLSSLSLSNGRPQKLRYTRSWFALFPRLEELVLIRMGLNMEHFKDATFPESWRETLKSLTISDNDLKKIPWRHIRFPKLERLDLSSNYITDISKYSHFPVQLTYLNISHNYISRLNSQNLLRLTNATTIDISNNQLKGMTWNVTQIDAKLQPGLKLYLGNNNWACICGFPWFKLLIHRQETTRNGHLTMDEINNTLRCGYRGNHDGQLIKDVPYDVFYCPGEKIDIWFWKSID